MSGSRICPSVGATVVCALSLCTCAMAATPLSKLPETMETLPEHHALSTLGSKIDSISARVSAPSAHLDAIAHAASPPPSQSSHLDLAIPEHFKNFEMEREANVSNMEPASPAAHSVAVAMGQEPLMVNQELFLKRFRREGLPVAKLWQNHSALVSVGLNGKGKPGLWLTQKIH